MGEKRESFSIAHRLAGAEDAPFLQRLFREAQQDLMAALGVAAGPLIDVQYRGRAMTYAATYPQAEDFILLGQQGEAQGRLLIDRSTENWRIVDVAVLQAHRGQGLGRAVLQELQRLAARAEAAIRLNVAPANPARWLYERTGFRVVSETPTGIEMRWQADNWTAP